MERDLSSYRDRAQSFSSGSPEPKKPGFLKHLMGMTAEQRQFGKERKEHVRGMLKAQRSYRESHRREMKEVLEDFDKGRLKEFQKYGISAYEYKTKPEQARKKVELRMKRDQMRYLHKSKLEANQTWKAKAKELKDPKPSPPGHNLAA